MHRGAILPLCCEGWVGIWEFPKKMEEAWKSRSQEPEAGRQEAGTRNQKPEKGAPEPGRNLLHGRNGGGARGRATECDGMPALFGTPFARQQDFEIAPGLFLWHLPRL